MLHQIGRVIYGTADAFGGSSVSLGRLAPYFQEQYSRMEWIGPTLAGETDPLQARVLEILAARGQFDNASAKTNSIG